MGWVGCIHLPDVCTICFKCIQILQLIKCDCFRFTDAFSNINIFYINSRLKNAKKRWGNTVLWNLDILSEENEYLLCSSICDKKYKNA